MDNISNDIHLVFCKHTDVLHLKEDITFDLCAAINKVVKWQALGAQKLRGVWVIRIRTPEARTTLLSTTLHISNREIKLYGANPYSMAEGRARAERVVFKDFPLWETNALISKFIKTIPQLVPLSDDVHFSKARNNATKAPSSFINGDRYIYLKPEIDPPLPEKVMIGSYECRLWYASRDLKCKRCGEAHKTNNIHRCDYYMPPSDDILVFNSGPLSNFHRCDVSMGPLTFSSSEHAYQFRACEEHLRADLAEMVLKARTPGEAKRIASQIKDEDPNVNWHVIKYDVMRDVLMAKINSNQEIKAYLMSTGDRLLVEASPSDSFWGSGFSHALTRSTLPEKYPGKNMLGRLLCEIRDTLRNQGTEPADPSSSDGQQTHSNSTATSVIDEHERPTTVRNGRTLRRDPTTRRSASDSPARSSRRSFTPLIRDAFKHEAKRKRANSAECTANTTPAQPGMADDDAASVSSFGSFVESSENRLEDFDAAAIGESSNNR